MKILIFANGLLENTAELHVLLKEADLLIAADGGANHCEKLAITPDILLGDLDSIDPAVLATCNTAGVEIHRYPIRKDATDLELALDLALTRGAESVWLLGALGGRWDMSLANIMLAAAKKYCPLHISLLDQHCLIHILHPGKPFTVTGKIGQTVSFLPIKGDIHGLNATGFEYPLKDHTINFGSTLGISNVLTAETSSVSFTKGTLLCTLLLHNQ